MIKKVGVRFVINVTLSFEDLKSQKLVIKMRDGRGSW